MTTYTTLPQDDSNLDVTLTESNDLITLDIQPAAVSVSGAVQSVNGESGVVVLDSDDIAEGVVNLYATDTRIDARIDLQTGANLDLSFADTDELAEGPTNLYYTEARVDANFATKTTTDLTEGTNLYSKQPNAITDDVTFNSVTAGMYGVSYFTAKAREAIGAGQPVYISGHSGNTPEVMLADYADPAKIPAFGIASAAIADNGNGAIATAGDLKNIDTTGTAEGETWAVGDNLYVNGSKLTNVRPGSETQAVQSLAKVIRVHPTVGQLFLSGAGRVNDIPNLSNKHVFIGDTVAPERRQLTYTDILNTPTIPADQTLSFANPNLSISNGNTVDLSTLTPDLSPYALTTYVDTQDGVTLSSANTYTDNSIAAIPAPDLTNLTDVVSIAPDAGGLTITDAASTTVEWGSNAKLQWRSNSDGGMVNQWVFDNVGADIFTGMHWRTSGNRKIFRFDAVAPGGIDPGDGSHATNFTVSGVDNVLKSRQHNETKTGLTIDALSLNLQSDNGVSFNNSYTIPTFDGAAGQVLITDGDGTVDWGDQSGGGGGGSLASLSDVSLLNLQNNDLLMYNSTALEWQNTNLGLTVTPILSGVSLTTIGANYTLTVTNHAGYDDPSYFVEVYNGEALEVPNSLVTNNEDGTLEFIVPSTPANLQIRVRCQDFGDLQSEIATLDFTSEAFGGTFRYWRITDVTCVQGNWWMLANMRFYTAPGQTGTAYPANMTSDTAPAPYVVTQSNNYNASYPGWKSMDSAITTTFYWTIGSSDGPADWVQIDLGSSINIGSATITSGNGADYAPTGFAMYASDTGAFAGEETLIITQSGLPAAAGHTTNLG